MPKILLTYSTIIQFREQFFIILLLKILIHVYFIMKYVYPNFFENDDRKILPVVANTNK